MRQSTIVCLLGVAAAIVSGGPRLAAVSAESPPLPLAIENGDANGDWRIDLSDAIYILTWLYLGGPPLAPSACGVGAFPRNGDVNGDGDIDLSDGAYLLHGLFLGGRPPVELECGGGIGGGGGAAERRPLSDFLSAQGTFCQDVLGDGTCYLFNPPVPNFLGFSNDTDTNNDGVPDKPQWFAGVDYAGLANGYFGDLFDTRLSGSVFERPLADGRAEVTVTLRATGANGWVIPFDLSGDVLAQIAGATTVFGHRPEDVARGAEPAIGDSWLHTVFINGSQGAPLPDILQVVFGPGPDQELESLHFLWRGAGPLTALFGVPEGFPGRCTIQQDGVLTAGASYRLVGGDGFPAELIDLVATGR